MDVDSDAAGDDGGRANDEPVYLTRALLEVLLETAEAREPEVVTVGLAVTPAGDLDGPDADGSPSVRDLAPGTPVFTHVYWPEAGGSVSAVFGVDLAIPPGRTPGLFVSHPDGSLEVSRTDDLREVVVVAVPPWSPDGVAAFGRDGGRRPIRLVDGQPPEETPP